jgi:thioredoxin-related protein
LAFLQKMKKLIPLLCFPLIALVGKAQNTINWMTPTQLQEAMKEKPKKVFIDVYTDWCGWCKKMDASTFVDPVIVQYMNENYYAVKFNAEQKDTLHFNNFAFYNLAPDKPRGTHLFAYSLLDGQMSYPSYALLDEKYNRINVIPGYKPVDQLYGILIFFATNQYQYYNNYLLKQFEAEQQLKQSRGNTN